MPAPLRALIAELQSFELVQVTWSIGLLFGSWIVAFVFERVLREALRRWSLRADTPVGEQIVQRLHAPMRWLLPLTIVRVVVPLTDLPVAASKVIAHVLLLSIILVVGWLAAAVVAVVEDVINGRFDLAQADNLVARSVHTQVRGFRNIARFAIGVLSVSSVLMTFEGVRQLGVSLLASAGIIGIVVGFAAQRSIATIIAGLQIAITQPIRVDDVVIVEGEWGRIEEITLTYVVVRIWDLRRLIVPITYFLEKPFQNWTRVSAELLGTVYLYVDYCVEVEALRAELERILETSPQWDGKVCGLVVTDATEQTVQLRALMSAEDSGLLWDLRCVVRERLIAYVQRKYPDSLPRMRASLEGPDSLPGA